MDSFAVYFAFRTFISRKNSSCMALACDVHRNYRFSMSFALNRSPLSGLVYVKWSSATHLINMNTFNCTLDVVHIWSIIRFDGTWERVHFRDTDSTHFLFYTQHGMDRTARKHTPTHTHTNQGQLSKSLNLRRDNK